jgi:MFS family permease
MGLSLSYVIGFTILAQISNIFTIKTLGRYTDRFSNKTIINICAPIFIGCILSWMYAAVPDNRLYGVVLLATLSVISGTATGGINLALNNIGMKLAPRREAMAYMSSLNMVVAFFSAISPIIAGLLADSLATEEFVWNMQMKNDAGIRSIEIINIHGWGFLFVLGGLLAIASLKLLSKVKEPGEIQKDRVLLYMRIRLQKHLNRNSRSVHQRLMIRSNQKAQKISQVGENKAA